jgi:hypothetical protein
MLKKEIGSLGRSGGRIEQFLSVHMERADGLLPFRGDEPIGKDLASIKF